MIRAVLGAAFASGIAGTASAQTLNMMKSIDAPALRRAVRDRT
jgi:hypothetical protein